MSSSIARGLIGARLAHRALQPAICSQARLFPTYRFVHQDYNDRQLSDRFSEQLPGKFSASATSPGNWRKARKYGQQEDHKRQMNKDPSQRRDSRRETLPLSLVCSKYASKFVNRHTASKIRHWGLEGSEFLEVAKMVLGDGAASSKLYANELVLELLRRWHDSAKGRLRRSIEADEVNEFWNGPVINSIPRQNLQNELERLMYTSFLMWLQREVSVCGSFGTPIATRIQTLLDIVDLRHPSLLYPTARTLKRHIHLHVGPTNSGKTHGALKALCNARTGVYAGPLRLLAHEVWHRINSGTVSPGVAARPCNLITGEEQRISADNATLLACTVEMLSTNEIHDVAVIDEIQMIADPQRGYAWTTAVLGLPAKEIYLCGEKSVVPLIEKMAKACGDVVHVHDYERLTPLRTEESIGSLDHVQKGDCVVAFSRTTLFEVKDQIERKTGLKCAIAYGALPPETKAEQARLFNDPTSDIDVMVASDAIGMGLNLKIKRIVFTTVSKWNGKVVEDISDSQIKQIAGRAGRYDANADGEPSGGVATTLHIRDLPILQRALASPLVPITHAAIQPSDMHLERLAATMKGTTGIVVHDPESGAVEPVKSGKIRRLAWLYNDMMSLMRIDPTTYFGNRLDDQSDVATIIEESVIWTNNLTLPEKDTFSKAPIQTKDDLVVTMFGNMLREYAIGSLVSFNRAEEGLGMFDVLNSILEAQALQNQLADPTIGNEKRGELRSQSETIVSALDINDLMKLESLHRSITLYMWLSMRFPTAFCYREEVERRRTEAEAAIDFALRAIRANRQARLASMGRQDSREVREKFKKRKGKQSDLHGSSSTVTKSVGKSPS